MSPGTRDGGLGDVRDLVLVGQTRRRRGCSAAASSCSVKPSADRSAPSADRSFSSSCSISRSQPAFRAMRLSASTSCRRCASVRPAQHDHRHLGQAELPRRGEPAVAGDDVAVLADQDRVGEAERADAAGDLGDLRVAVGAGIARVRHQPLERPVLDAEPSVGVVGDRVQRRRSSIAFLRASPTPPTPNFAALFSRRRRHKGARKINPAISPDPHAETLHFRGV